MITLELFEVTNFKLEATCIDHMYRSMWKCGKRERERESCWDQRVWNGFIVF